MAIVARFSNVPMIFSWGADPCWRLGGMEGVWVGGGELDSEAGMVCGDVSEKGSGWGGRGGEGCLCPSL